MSQKRALFFCSAIKGISPKYNQAAQDIVRAACSLGYDIASGGTVRGTMDVVCRTAKECGAKVYGAIPIFMKGLESPCLDECLWTETMSQRKDLMRQGATVAIALPGGIGTMDELAETMCLAKLGIFKGHVIVFNVDGFYNPFKQQLDVFVREGMFPEEELSKVSFPETVEELVALL